MARSSSSLHPRRIERTRPTGIATATEWIPPALRSPGHKLKLGESDDRMGSCRVGNLRKLEGCILPSRSETVKLAFVVP